MRTLDLTRGVTVALTAAAAAFLAPTALSQDVEGGEEQLPPPRRVLLLKVEEVGRLALRNSPAYRARTLDPLIARAAEDEALGEFDPLFAASVTGGRARSRVFFDPSAFRGGAGDDLFLLENTYSGGAAVSSVEEWGGQWRLGYDVVSTDRRGASSISALSPRYDGLLSLGYTHPLLRGAGREVRLSRYREAQRLTTDAEMALRRTAEETVAAAEDAYWELVGAIADRDVVRKSVEVAQELLDVARARLEARRGIPVEVAEAEAGLARREGELIAADALVGNGGDKLRALVLPFVGEEPDLDLVIEPVAEPAGDPQELPPAPGRSELDAAFAARGDVVAAAARLDAARLAEVRATNDVEYELNAILSGGLRGLGTGFSTSSTSIGGRDQYQWEAGFELAIPLGNVAAEARADRARHLTRRAERLLASQRNTVAQELREAARNLRSAAERIRAAQRAVTAAQQQLDAERARLRNGRSTPFRVLEVEEDLSAAAAAEIRARVDYEKARVAHALASGTLLTGRALEDLLVAE